MTVLSMGIDHKGKQGKITTQTEELFMKNDKKYSHELLQLSHFFYEKNSHGHL